MAVGKNPQIPPTRKRLPPVNQEELFGDFAHALIGNRVELDKLADRAAYMYVTGNFPSHLRIPATRMLRQISRPFKKPSSLDGRQGDVKVVEDAVRVLRLRFHPMVVAVKERISNGYLIHPNPSHTSRRPFTKIYMFKLDAHGAMCAQLIINLDGSTKPGWHVKR